MFLNLFNIFRYFCKTCWSSWSHKFERPSRCTISNLLKFEKLWELDFTKRQKHGPTTPFTNYPLRTASCLISTRSNTSRQRVGLFNRGSQFNLSFRFVHSITCSFVFVKAWTFSNTVMGQAQRFREILNVYDSEGNLNHICRPSFTCKLACVGFSASSTNFVCLTAAVLSVRYTSTSSHVVPMSLKICAIILVTNLLFFLYEKHCISNSCYHSPYRCCHKCPPQ